MNDLAVDAALNQQQQQQQQQPGAGPPEPPQLQLHPQHPGADLAALFKGCTAYDPVSLGRESDNC